MRRAEQVIAKATELHEAIGSLHLGDLSSGSKTYKKQAEALAERLFAMLGLLESLVKDGGDFWGLNTCGECGYPVEAGVCTYCRGEP